MSNVIERARAVLADLDAEGDVERGGVVRDLLAIVERQNQTITLAASTHDRGCSCHVCAAAEEARKANG